MKLTLFPSWKNSQRLLSKTLIVILASVGIFLANDVAVPQSAAAYPFWAQQTYPITPREPTGRIVCANCHLAAKPTEIEVPQSVKPDTVFEAVVKIPYDQSVQQVTANGVKGPLNVGAVLMLPDGFKIAPEDRLTPEMKEKTQGLYFQPYGEGNENTVIIGPLPGDKYQEIIFPVLSPNPKTKKAFTSVNTKSTSVQIADADRFILLERRATTVYSTLPSLVMSPQSLNKKMVLA